MTTFKSERHRPSIAGRIAVLDDLRSGSVTLTTGRCAKPLCHGLAIPDMVPIRGRPTRSTASPSSQRFPLQPRSGRRKERSLKYESCKSRTRNSFRSMRGSAKYVRAKTSRRQHREKTADAFQKEVSRERDQWLHVVFASRRKTGRIDLEAIRPAMHRAGAAGLTQFRSRRRAANPCVFPRPAGSLPETTVPDDTLRLRRSR